MDEELGHFGVDLDGRFSNIRTGETNLGNFVCDVMLSCMNADVAILNSGTLRSDRIHKAGKFIMKDLMEILPMADNMCIILVTGKPLPNICDTSNAPIFLRIMVGIMNK